MVEWHGFKVDSYCTLIPQSYETQLDSMGRIRHELKLQILQMHKDGMSVAGIRRRLVEMGHRVSRDTISYWIHKYRVGLFGQSLNITVPVVNTNVSERHTEIIKECLAQDSTLSSRDIHKILRDAGATFGLSTTKWAIDASGFTHSKPCYGQMVREPNKVKRVEFCERLIATNEDFSDVIFSDECSVQLNQNKACSYRLKEAHSTVLPKPKHALKIHVWAAVRLLTKVLSHYGSDPEFSSTALSTSFARPHCTMYSLPTIMSLSSRKY